MSENGWTEWSKYVLKTLEETNEDVKVIRQDVSKLFTEIAMLKVKAGIWGAMGGAIPVVVLLLVWMVKNGS